MKRISGILLILLFAFLVPLLTASGQEKKNEQKIKVVINDGSGEKTILDTTFTGDKLPGMIKLKEGKIITIGDLEDTATGKGNVYVYSSSGNKPGKHIIIASSGDKPHEWTVERSVIESDDVMSHNAANSYSITVSDDMDSDSDAPKYIIAKDGIVVTIQCDDEAKVKELKQLIENKLGVKNEKEAGKTDNKTQKK